MRPVRLLEINIGAVAYRPPGWAFGKPITNNGQVSYTCSARVPQQARDAAPIVRFTDRNGNLYFSYLGYTGRFSQTPTG